MMISPLRRLKARPMALDYAPCLVLASGLGGQNEGVTWPRLNLPDTTTGLEQKRGME